jgi:hypothetical protein
MKRASYREAIWWIALNDEPGLGPDSRNPEVVATLISVALVADIFGVSTERVGLDVVRRRDALAKVRS